MIIIKFHGGLGNQMFEYAFLKQMQKRYPDVDIKAHIPHIKDFNGYELKSVFGIEINEASKWQVRMLSDYYPDGGHRFINILYKIRRSIFGVKNSYLVQDDYTSFYENVYELNPLYSYYLMGVWANENYLKGIDEELRSEFVFNNNGLSCQNQKLICQINNSNSVAIHVRRNDYITLGAIVTSDEYYTKAIEYIQCKIRNPVFYIFSDDHDYCEKLFKDINHTIVKGNTGKDSFRDMQLMSYCKHNIIANSTFSFWAAYLNSNVEKIVIFPNISFGNCRHPFACNGWVKIDI